MSVSNTSGNKPETGRRPVVAIAGRPNVGKSTLFNRIIKSRKAITDPTPGVTRDPVEGVAEINGLEIKFVDTGGYKLDQEELDDLVVKRSLEIVAEADLVILVLDLKETTSEDEIFIEEMRPYSDKLMLVVNKVDGPEKEEQIWNYYSLGFDKVYPVSASHGLGFGDLIDALYERVKDKAAAGDGGDAGDDLINLAVLGKPNTGKSTLTNLFTKTNSSIVSDIPGTTRDIVEGFFSFKNRGFRVLDTAGIRKKKKVSENVEYYSVNRAIKSIDESDVVLLMIDSIEGLSDQDKKIANLIVRKGKGVIIVLNKWDLQENIPNVFEAVSDRIRFLFPILSFAPIVALSALNNDGVENLLDTVLKVKHQLGKRVDTSTLNNHLTDWMEENEPPRSKKGRYKIKYMTQVSSEPIRFLLFVNNKKSFPEAYQRYILRMIRQDFGLPSVPITMELRG
ncbi:MAG: ribosome biogenesis GTPase Der [Spirochaetales bacterium]|uniref:GTPase Der n=1 Tax=Candidatus Thalassospirochaeta sargassi TaxID=3119039 RepID=A0AAJ1ID41_9SPIO|nr:ribosome biogenesis GTPase Der [Spirochaetales bacterium]